MTLKPMTNDSSLVHRILDARSVTTLFQPLVSVKRGRVFAVEALSRGLNPDTGETIPPAVLFSRAERAGLLLELDRLCRERALENFRPIFKRNKALVLSMNIDAAIIGPETARSNHVLGAAIENEIPPHNIIIEIIESKARDSGCLYDFVDQYKKKGFLIALDDVGAGHSNLHRIPTLTPDVLKIDRGLITDIQNHYYKREIVNSLVKLADKIGALPLAEGVETQDEALALMELGVEFFQGWHFGMPAPDLPGVGALDMVFNSLADSFRERVVSTISRKKARHARLNRMVDSLCAKLSAELFPGACDSLLSAMMEERPNIECCYILDMGGVQISDTMCNPDRLKESHRLIYEPAVRGADHSLKSYYLPLSAGLDRFTTEPYVSLASGNMCITVSRTFSDATGGQRILCVDVASDSDAR